MRSIEAAKRWIRASEWRPPVVFIVGLGVVFAALTTPVAVGTGDPWWMPWLSTGGVLLGSFLLVALAVWFVGWIDR